MTEPVGLDAALERLAFVASACLAIHAPGLPTHDARLEGLGHDLQLVLDELRRLREREQR